MISIINQIVSFPFKIQNGDKTVIEYKTVIIIDKKQRFSNNGYTHIEHELILNDGSTYHTSRKIFELNSDKIKILPIEEQINAFNTYFYKFINPPEHLKDHLTKK